MMNQIDRRQMEQHVQILGWLLVVSHIFFLLIGLFVFTLLTSIGAVSGDRDAMMILSIVGTGVGALLAVLGVPGVIAGYGLLKRKVWGRILAIIVGILSLANFPLGTAVGIYTLWVLLSPAAIDYFMPPSDQI